MKADALLADLRSRGVNVLAIGDRIRFRPADALTDSDRALLIEHKADILALLAGEAALSAPKYANWYMPAPRTPTTPSGWATITLAWPASVSVPVVKGQWTRAEDGTITATYTRGELETALTLAGGWPPLGPGDAVFLVDQQGATHNHEPWPIIGIDNAPDGTAFARFAGPLTSWPLALCRRAPGVVSG